MSEIKVNKISPKQTCTQLTLGDSGDTIIIPAGATITNNGTATGFGRTGTVDWDTTKKTSGFTAVSGIGYFCDTTSAAFTVTLPSSPSAGAIVGICDYANTFATNNITVGRNSSNIGGFAVNATLSTSGIAVTFVYVDATQGWIVTDSGNRSDLPAPQFVAATGGTVTTCGNYKIHTFTGPGTFCVSNAGNPAGSSTVDYLVVAGGGGGGRCGGAGGGAGGYRTSFPGGSALSVSVTGYPITVGSGGAGKSGNGKGAEGNNSIFSTITSAGGGGGSGRDGGSGNENAGSGGSGGGGQYDFPGSQGSGNTPVVSPPQGNNGGNGGGFTNPAGGGGGASAVGGNAGPPVGGVGGAGSSNSITGSSVTYAGGGGGGGPIGPGNGGSGGGGRGSPSLASGTANTGGGGGGCVGGTAPAAGSGGSGIVVIRYKFQ